jgi:hypothetical protein
MAIVYTYKMVNGVKVALSAGEKTTMAAHDAAPIVPGGGDGAGTTMMVRSQTTAAKVENLARSFGVTLAELKAELGK